MKTIDERINDLENLFWSPIIAGTTISRVLTQNDGLQWCLALGAMYEPKKFFDGVTIEDCIDAAETHYYELLK